FGPPRLGRQTISGASIFRRMNRPRSSLASPLFMITPKFAGQATPLCYPSSERNGTTKVSCAYSLRGIVAAVLLFGGAYSHAHSRTGNYVDIRATTTRVPEGIRVDFVVREQLFFNRVLISGLVSPPSDASAIAAVQLPLGEPYQGATLEEGLERLRETLREEG